MRYLLDSVLDSGLIGLFLWGMLLVLSLLGLALGLLSVASAVKQESDRYPLSLKLLTVSMVATYVCGMLGMVAGCISGFSSLASGTGAGRAEVLAYSLSVSRVPLFAGVTSSATQLVLWGVCLLVLRHRRGKTEEDGAGSVRHVMNVPKVAYAVVVCAAPAGYGIALLSWMYERLLTVRPGESLGDIAGMGLSMLTSVALISACLGALLSFGIVILVVAGHGRGRRDSIVSE